MKTVNLYSGLEAIILYTLLYSICLYIISNSVFGFYEQVFPALTEGNLVAQPAIPVNEDRTDLLGIPQFWAKTSVNPLFIWETWV